MCIDVHEELVVGNIKTGEVFSFMEVGFTATADFNFWAAFNAYNLDDGYTEEAGLDFTDFLKNCELANVVQANVEGNPELAATLKAAGELWASYGDEKQRSLAFEEFTKLVTIEGLKEFATLVPNARELGLNDPQILTLASNLDFVQQGHEIRYFINMANDVGKIDYEFLVDCVRAINFAAMQLLEEATMAQQGYNVRAVFPTEEGGHDFAYSESGNTKVGWDAFSIMHGLSCRTLAVFVDNFITLASQDDDFDPLAINEQCGKLSDGRPLRLKAIEADAHRAHAAGFYVGRIQDNHRFLQILVPDGNNVLPDEEGYDATSFDQPMFPLTAGDATLN